MSLTDRQTEFLVLAARGKTRCQIAEETFVSPVTVKKEFVKIRGELDADNIAHAVAKAIALELIGIDHEGHAYIPMNLG